jgi:anti-anti-sigma factor
MSGLQINQEKYRSGVAFLELRGYLDAHNFEKLDAAFEAHFQKETYRFVVDIRHLEYVSSAGAGVFIGAVGTCQDNGGNIVLVQPAREVREILELLGVYQIFPVVQQPEQALDYFASCSTEARLLGAEQESHADTKRDRKREGLEGSFFPSR